MPGPMNPNFGGFGSPRGGNQTQASFDPSMLIGPALTLGGGILGAASTPKRLDLNDIRSMFGGQALVGETNSLFKMLMQSPAFQQIMQGGAQQGSMLQGRLAQQLGKSGLGGSPMGGMMKAASMGYGSQLQRQGQTQLFMQALQTAMQNMQGQMGMFAQQQQIPSFGQMLGGSMMGAGAQGFGGMLNK